jgi:glutamate formiminotransferase
MLECVVNVSEGRDGEHLERITRGLGRVLLDVHRDPGHNRSVLTLAGTGSLVEAAARVVTARAARVLDLAEHTGAHPRFGVVDVVPFIAIPEELAQSGLSPVEADVWRSVSLDPAVRARDRFCEWAATRLSIPCFRYGPLPDGTDHMLPDVRRHAFVAIRPDLGPDRPHPTAGAVAVGARPPLIAYNVWLAGTGVDAARRLASLIRSQSVRALGLDLGTGVQVSCNLVDPFEFGPADLYDLVAAHLTPPQKIARAELVGLMPGAVLRRIPPERWTELDVSVGATIDARLGAR